MTSLLPAPRRTRSRARPGRTRRTAARWCSWRSSPASSLPPTLLVCLAGGVVGWFLTDAGAHGAPATGCGSVRSGG